MATGHMNPGYNNIVSRFKSALDNPSGIRSKLISNDEQLKDIRAKAKSAWSIPDHSETSYSNFFKEPNKQSKVIFRPSSPSRRNNPHPNK